MRVDRIFEGGTLLTMDPARPRATALAVLGGRIVAVGDGDELRRRLNAERVVSLQGPKGIAAIEVLGTVVGGRVAHDRIGLR
jgi:predicted amidohydrolase YtcJ